MQVDDLMRLRAQRLSNDEASQIDSYADRITKEHLVDTVRDIALHLERSASLDYDSLEISLLAVLNFVKRHKSRRLSEEVRKALKDLK
jgi:hypothetical protein